MKLSGKKILKISSLSILGVGFVGLMVGVSKSWNNLKTVNMGGSSAVLSLMTSLSNIYKEVDIIASPGGSGAGINHILKGTKEIGMASKDPGIIDFNKKQNEWGQEELNIWKEKRAKTITIAWDGMGLIYKPANINDDLLDLNEETMAKIYASFSGIKQFKLNDLGLVNDDSFVVPYARNGGSTTSGTAEAFISDSHLEYENSNFWQNELGLDEQKEIKKILKSGDYKGNVLQTAESNSQAWNRVKNAKPGAMTYLSAGYILNNQKEIESKGFKIATYKGTKLSQETITKDYNWFRPFNLMFSLNFIEDKIWIKEMIESFFNEESINVIKENNYLPLDEKQIQSMKGEGINQNFFSKSDYELGYSGARQ